MIWLIEDGMVQLYAEQRRQWQLQRYEGNAYLHIDNSDLDALPAETVAELKKEYWQDMQSSCGLADTYIEALFIYDKSNPLMADVCGTLYDWVKEHNQNVASFDSTHEWPAGDLASMLDDCEGTLVIQEASLDDWVVNHRGGELSITTSQGTTYVVPEKPKVELTKVESNEAISSDAAKAHSGDGTVANLTDTAGTQVTDSNQNGPQAASSVEVSVGFKRKELPTEQSFVDTTVVLAPETKSSLKSKDDSQNTGQKPIETQQKREVPMVAFADATPANRVKSKEETIHEHLRNLKEQVEHESIIKKPKATNEELSKILKEETKDFNHTVREPR